MNEGGTNEVVTRHRIYIHDRITRSLELGQQSNAEGEVRNLS